MALKTKRKPIPPPKKPKTTATKAYEKQKKRLDIINGIPLRAKGRTLYTDLMGEIICERVANGESVAKICTEDGFPTAGTVMEWINFPDELQRPGFQEKYLKAKQVSLHLMADEIIHISDDTSEDTKVKIINGRQITFTDHEHINRSNLRVKSRQWMLSKMLPKVYGDKLQVEHDLGSNLMSKMEKARARLQGLDRTIAAKVIDATEVEQIGESEV